MVAAELSNQEEGDGKLFPVILQVVRTRATAEEEDAAEELSVAPPPRAASLPACWFVVVGLTAVSPLRG